MNVRICRKFSIFTIPNCIVECRCTDKNLSEHFIVVNFSGILAAKFEQFEVYMIHISS